MAFWGEKRSENGSFEGKLSENGLFGSNPFPSPILCDKLPAPHFQAQPFPQPPFYPPQTPSFYPPQTPSPIFPSPFVPRSPFWGLSPPFFPSDTSDLHFRATKDRCGGQPLFFERFPALWSGARSTHGVTAGKVCFEAKVRRGGGLGSFLWGLGSFLWGLGSLMSSWSILGHLGLDWGAFWGPSCGV